MFQARRTLWSETQTQTLTLVSCVSRVLCHVQCAMCNDVNVNAVSVSPWYLWNCVSVSVSVCVSDGFRVLCVSVVCRGVTFACLLSFRRSVSCGLRQNTCDAPVTTTKTSQRTIHQLHTLPFKKATIGPAPAGHHCERPPRISFC